MGLPTSGARAAVVGALLLGVTFALPSCDGEDDDAPQLRTIGGVTFFDHGTVSVRVARPRERHTEGGKTKVKLAADSFYFEPTFLRGEPGQKLVVAIENESEMTHNFSIDGSIDHDISPGDSVEAEVTFPAAGKVLFFCKYHAHEGMNGELLVGDVEP